MHKNACPLSIGFCKASSHESKFSEFLFKKRKTIFFLLRCNFFGYREVLYMKRGEMNAVYDAYTKSYRD